jgi:hypothetical protein
MSIDVVITEIAIATELSISSFVTNWIYGFNLHKLIIPQTFQRFTTFMQFVCNTHTVVLFNRLRIQTNYLLLSVSLNQPTISDNRFISPSY